MPQQHASLLWINENIEQADAGQRPEFVLNCPGLSCVETAIAEMQSWVSLETRSCIAP